jgi:RNA polymerase I-specific transcription initiation factor RRN3
MLARVVSTSCVLQSLSNCASAFVSFLLKRIHDPNRPAITRTACAAYLASFLARAKFLPKPLLIQSLLSMAQWCADYCKTQDQRQLATSFPATSTFELGIQHQVDLPCYAIVDVL